MKRMLVLLTAALLASTVVLVSACSTDAPAEERPVPTYYQDVAPVLAQRCTSCHTAKGIGPFPLTSYDEVKPVAEVVRSAVESRHMPPLPPDPDDCQPIDDYRAITPAERETIVRWVAAGSPVGDAATAAPTPPPTVEALGPASDVYEAGFDYLSKYRGDDEYRCFVIDPKFVDTTYGYAFNLRSTTPRLVHHADLRFVRPSDVAKLDALEAKDPEPGYECFGGFEVEAESLAGGGAGRSPPDGTGYTFAPGTKFVVQLHYNYANGRERSGLAMEMWRSPTPLLRTPDAFGVTTANILIPAGAPDTAVSALAPVVARDAPVAPGQIRAGLVWELTPHMHQLGKSTRVDVVHPDGSRTCLINVPRWQMNWQGTYRLARPVAINAGDQLELTCHWDNSPGHQPLVENRPREPREVRFGEGTEDEMCFAGGIVTAPR